MKGALRWLALCAVAVAGLAFAQADRPSRPAQKGCAWQKLHDTRAGLDAWVQACDFGFRRIDHFMDGNRLRVRYSDGGEAYAVIEVFDLKPGETPQAGLTRIFRANTDKALAARCMLARYKGEDRPPAGVLRYEFVPDRAYAKEVRAKTPKDEIGDPPCGDYGHMPDSVQYFEVRSGGSARKVLLVRAGQDEPLFDEKTLRPFATP